MAAVPVTIDGVLCDLYGRTIQRVKLVGEMIRSDVGIGGGPIIPPPNGPPDEKPPRPPLGIWPGPGDPDFPGGRPPDGVKPPDPVGPPVSWKAVWHPTEGWIVVGIINPSVDHPVPSS